MSTYYYLIFDHYHNKSLIDFKAIIAVYRRIKNYPKNPERKKEKMDNNARDDNDNVIDDTVVNDDDSNDKKKKLLVDENGNQISKNELKRRLKAERYVQIKKVS